MDPTEETARLNAEEYIKAQAEATRWAMRCGVEKSLKEQALARIAELEAASRDALLAASESRCDQAEIILAAALR